LGTGFTLLFKSTVAAPLHAAAKTRNGKRVFMAVVSLAERRVLDDRRDCRLQRLLVSKLGHAAVERGRFAAILVAAVQEIESEPASAKAKLLALHQRGDQLFVVAHAQAAQQRDRLAAGSVEGHGVSGA